MNAFVAGMPKSGGTHITHCLSTLLNLKWVSTVGVHGEGMEEHVINPQAAQILFPYGGFSFHQHTRATPMNVRWLKTFKVKPIVVLRGIKDVIVSLKDYIDKEGQFVGLVVPSEWGSLSEHNKLMWLARNATPWLCSFYYSWNRTDIERYTVTYEDFFADQKEHLRKMCLFLGGEANEIVLDKVVKTKSARFNVGIVGRGRDIPRSVDQAIDEVIRTWRMVDGTPD
jgi:hypothetical protein